MDLFARLDDACELFSSGRENAARAIWSEFPDDFRLQVMKFVVFVFQHKHYLDDLTNEELVELDSRFGKWKPTKPKVEKMLAAVQKLCQTQNK